MKIQYYDIEYGNYTGCEFLYFADDATRVVLVPPPDYINANYLKVSSLFCRPNTGLICTQR